MGFFHSLDDGRYAEFKQNVKNWWAMKSMNPLTTVNEIYTLGGVWVKPTIRGETGMGATYHTEQKKTSQKEDGKAEEDKKPQKDLSKVKRYGCGKKDHMKNSPLCPKNVEKEKKRQADGAGFMNATWCEEIEASMYAMVRIKDKEMKEYVVDKAVNMTKGISLTQVLLDNQAEISVMHPMMLSDVRPVKRKIRVSGVGGVQLIADKVGMLDVFFQVYASEETKANVLNFADIEDKYKITYMHGQTFTVHMPEEDIVFKRKNKLYVADWL
jgi:phage pi2 protein 07